MDGFEAARTIHRMCDEWGITRVPIVAVTASVSSALHEESREAGMMQVRNVAVRLHQINEVLREVLTPATSATFVKRGSSEAISTRIRLQGSP